MGIIPVVCIENLCPYMGMSVKCVDRKLTVVSLVVMVLSRAAVAERAGEVALHLVARGQLGVVRGVRLTRQRVVFT